jgi:hypothetical protein
VEGRRGGREKGREKRVKVADLVRGHKKNKGEGILFMGRREEVETGALLMPVSIHGRIISLLFAHIVP